jgi:hypothetical protein
MELAMTESGTVGDVIRNAAVYALREYFMPIRVARRLAVDLYRRLTSPSRSLFFQTSCPDDPYKISLEEARQFLRAEISQTRSRERFLLFQSVFAAFLTVSLLIVDSLSNLYKVAEVTLGIIIVVTGLLSGLAAIAGVRKREEIVQLKMLRHLLTHIDAETAETVIRQLSWGNPQPKRNVKKHKKSH